MASLTQKYSKVYYFILLMLFTACSSGKRNLTYLSDITSNAELIKPIDNNVETKIQPRDVLSITINTSNPETNTLFNTGVVQASGNSANAPSSANTASAGYLVDNNGFVKFPVLGQVKVSGLTTEDASEKIAALIAENYVRGPVVNVRIVNFKITVIGEVRSPQTFVVPAARVNIFEALGLAGDMTDAGRRENVLVIRENNGTRSTIKINLNSREALNSPYYYLHQNDIIYVQSDKERLTGRSTLSTVLSIASIVSVISLVISRFF